MCIRDRVPSFLLVRDLKLLDSYWVLILPGIAGSLPFGILLLRTFFEGLPHELFESARLDGAGEAEVLRRIAVPLSACLLYTSNRTGWSGAISCDVRSRGSGHRSGGLSANRAPHRRTRGRTADLISV